MAPVPEIDHGVLRRFLREDRTHVGVLGPEKSGARPGLPSSSMHTELPTLRTSAADTTRVFSDDFFYLEFASGWSPPMDDASRRTTMDVTWHPFWDEMQDSKDATGVTYRYLAGLIDKWDASKTPGHFWNSGWGPSYRCFLHALQFLYTYSNIPAGFTSLGIVPGRVGSCEDARAAVIGAIEEAAVPFRARSLSGGGSYSLNDEPYGLPVGWKSPEEPAARRGLYNGFTRKISIDSGLLDAMGEVADLFMWQAHRAHWYAMEGHCGDLATSLSYLYQSRALGRMALSAIVDVAGTILHELLHWYTSTPVFTLKEEHCYHSCCMQKAQLTFLCNAAARFGLYPCNTSRIDIEQASATWSYGSQCRYPLGDTASTEAELACPSESDESFFFCGACQMDAAGAPGSASTWSRDGAWEVPERCS